MLAHQLKILTNTFIILTFCSLPSLAAVPESEPELVFESLSKSTTTDPLPLGTLLDSEGKLLPIPVEQSALDYSPPTVNIDNESPKAKTDKTQSTKTKKKKLSRKQQLASREKVANDPSCRWLDARMSQLETQIGNKQDKAADYQSDELSARRQEWQCLKCGVEGPNQDDHHRCQYRR
ncbi:hypothetical protein HRJ35_02315 [Shewanella oneidensis MR-1]|uniref:Predicted periplasmic protein n=1 Tax=Shewanella oneidensis (strain ATCC 700550 / JCM 31522 / CIP 106686 / LMG 19005 / NCIMB 14063 / MR-1) TaxID=211586 RepID=Q8E8G3_SHEON|nr:hypothetical protein [Shewanella oneidensis]AAN57660.1 predicted periplasmic protein [Shewanella oneidensis MR-1]MDX5998062.1 hypothetical protein [Shewanella oneidensis]MEE2029445.1 hypothetical protein [Shewanella oneidensis]QKG94939.1 hypothetical protein HRJ35_02315 [Shewanella oneidensis MR-1]